MANRRHSRREFISLTGAGIAGAVSGPWLNAQGAAAAAQTLNADLVVFNAKVYTVDSRAPKVEAFAVKAGRFTAVGSTEDVKTLIGKATQTFDAKQMTVVPGFIDCHNHAPGDVLLYDVLVGNPYVVEFVTIASIVDKLRAKARETPPGTWVEGFFFDDTKVKENRQLNVHDLDRVSKDLPVVVHHRGGHTSYYNSKALEMADINKGTPNPPGGTFDRDANGDLNGRVTDRARGALNQIGKRASFTADQKLQRDRDGLAYISKQFVRYGLTSVHHEGGDLFALQQVRARGDLLHRVSYESSGKVLEAMIASGISTGFGDERIRLGATSEHTVDGSRRISTGRTSQWRVWLVFNHSSTTLPQHRFPPRYDGVAANVNFPGFNGHLFSARREAARQHAMEADQKLRDEQERVSRDVRVAWAGAVDAFDRIDVTA